MYDIESLEYQWKRYKRKQFLWPIALSSVVIAAGVSVFFWMRQPASDEPKSVAASSRTPLPAEPAAAERSPKSLSPEVPSMREKSKKKKGWKITFEDEKPSGKKEKQASQKRSSPRIAITVTKKDTHLTAEEIENRFHSSPSKDDALFLARHYYRNKQYPKALAWALETNKLDSDIEESWLIFGKAKAKLGKRMEALRVLQAYYDRTGSAKAKTILDKIRRGKAF